MPNKREKFRRNPDDTAEFQKAARIFEDFHGKPPTQTEKITLESDEIPDTLILIGELIALEYKVVSGDRTGQVYRHEMGDVGKFKEKAPYYLCTDTSRRRFFLIPKNPKAKYPLFNERGIVG